MAENIYTALTKLQSELKAPKGQRNSFGNYNYRSAEDILEAVKPLLDKYSLTMITTDTIVNIGARYYVKATATVYGFDGSISVDGWARETKDKKGMDASQITGATSSYARKYAYNGLFSIDDTKDADSDEHRKQTTVNRPTPEPAPQRPTAPKPATDDKPTKTQLDTIYNLAIAKGMSDEEIRRALAKVTTKDMAEASIKKLEEA